MGAPTKGLEATAPWGPVRRPEVQAAGGSADPARVAQHITPRGGHVLLTQDVEVDTMAS